MTTHLVLGIDLGTSSVKVMVLDAASGAVVTQSSQPYPVDRRYPSWAETETADWWAAIDGAVLACGAGCDLGDVIGIGLSGQMHGLVLCGSDGHAVRPAVLWQDARATEETQRLQELPANVRSRLANPPFPGMAGPILGWLSRHEPSIVSQAAYALQPKDWIRGQLTGLYACEASDASATLLYNVLSGAWDADVIAALGIRSDLLPPILEYSGRAAGGLLARVASTWGIPSGTPVAAGAADTASAALGTGLAEEGSVQLTIGTGAQIIQIVSPPSIASVASGDPVAHLYRSAVPHGWYAMAAGLTGGTTLDWVRNLFDVSWAELYATAAHVPRGDDPIFLPHLVGERTPHLDASMRGAWVGLGAHHDRNVMLFAALEGVAFAIADGLDALPGVPHDDRRLRLAGGGTTDAAWQRLLARELHADLFAIDVASASARGAALLGLRSTGRVDDQGLLALAQTTETLIAPRPKSRDLSAERRARYQTILAAVRFANRP